MRSLSVEAQPRRRSATKPSLTRWTASAPKPSLSAEAALGSLARSTLASFGIVAVGAAAMAAMPGSDIAHQGVAVLVPVGQLIAALAIERRTEGRW